MIRSSIRRQRRWPYVLGVAVIVLIALLIWRHHGADETDARGKGGMAGMPVAVGVAKVEKADIPISEGALGTVTPLATAVVRAEVSGDIIKIGFTEGQHVRKGDFLVQVDPEPFEAALGQAEGQLARDEALLKNAKLDLERYRKLIKEDSVAQQTVDTAESTVRQYEGTVQADRALVKTQKISVSDAHVVSPITGRVGLRKVDLGNYVTAGDANGVVVVTQIEPISVVFTLPEDALGPVMAAKKNGQALTVTAIDRAGSKELAKGALESIDNQIDTSTGTIKMRARFDNKDERLFANQFVNVRLLVDTMHDALTVPTAAVQQGTPGTFVYVARDDHTVEVRKITPGPADNGRTAVMSGLKEGETVVTDGTDKLKDGAKVRLPGDPAPEAKDGKDAQKDKHSANEEEKPQEGRKHRHGA